LGINTLIDYGVVVDHIVLIDDCGVIVDVSGLFHFHPMSPHMIIAKMSLGNEGIVGVAEAETKTYRDPAAVVRETNAYLIM